MTYLADVSHRGQGHSPERRAFVTLLELHFLVERKPHRLGTHFKHLVHDLVYAMVFEATASQCGEPKSWREDDVLPESEFRGSLPEHINLLFIALLDELVVNNQQGMSWDIFRERREVGFGGHGDEGMQEEWVTQNTDWRDVYMVSLDFILFP